MKVIGITGPTGAGKTTALNVLRSMGCCILDADEVYHGMLETDADLRRALEDRFGPLTAPDGSFQRKKLGGIVFHDPEALRDLNAIAHSRVVAEMDRRLRQAELEGYPAAAIDAIGLFESGADRICSATVAVTAPPEVRVKRIMAREGIGEEYARSRVAAQHPDTFYTERCDFTLVNDCPGPEAFADRARELFESLLSQDAAGAAERRFS